MQVPVTEKDGRRLDGSVLFLPIQEIRAIRG
jgi:hypothetical protein